MTSTSDTIEDKLSEVLIYCDSCKNHYDDWRERESLKGDIIISVNETKYGQFVAFLSCEEWKRDALCRYDSISDIYFNVPIGLYYAKGYCGQCLSSVCKGMGGGNCWGDDFDVVWKISGVLYMIKTCVCDGG